MVISNILVAVLFLRSCNTIVFIDTEDYNSAVIKTMIMLN